MQAQNQERSFLEKLYSMYNDPDKNVKPGASGFDILDAMAAEIRGRLDQEPNIGQELAFHQPEACLATALNDCAPVATAEETSVNVKYWDAYNVEGTALTHQFDIADQRRTTGQAYITVGPLEGHVDEMLSVTMEINVNPLNGIDHVPCAHVHFDGDSLAVSLFKIGDKILVRPETGVCIDSFFQKVNGFGETLYWIE